MSLDVSPEGDEHVDMEEVPVGLTHGSDHVNGCLAELLEGKFLVGNDSQFAVCGYGRYEGGSIVVCGDKSKE